MFHLLRDLCSFKFATDPVVFATQTVSLVLLLYFIYNSVRKLFNELSAGHTFPALGVVYMLVSATLICIFIGYFGIITENYVNWFKFSYLNYQEQHDLYLDSDRIEDMRFYEWWMSVSLPLVLSAFAFNFSKAFSTLHALELGSLNDENLSDLQLGKPTKWAEGLFRLVIACAFIAIEKELADWNHGGKYDFVELFSSLATVIMILYLFLLIWYWILRKPIWNRPKFRIWRFLAPVQFFMGAILSLIYFFFSRLGDNNVKGWTRWFTVSVILMIILSLAIIAIVSLVEIIGWRNNRSHSVVASANGTAAVQ